LTSLAILAQVSGRAIDLQARTISAVDRSPMTSAAEAVSFTSLRSLTNSETHAPPDSWAGYG